MIWMKSIVMILEKIATMKITNANTLRLPPTQLKLSCSFSKTSHYLHLGKEIIRHALELGKIFVLRWFL